MTTKRAVIYARVSTDEQANGCCKPKGFVNYLKGANIAGFIKVADAMVQQGVL